MKHQPDPKYKAGPIPTKGNKVIYTGQTQNPNAPSVGGKKSPSKKNA